MNSEIEQFFKKILKIYNLGNISSTLKNVASPICFKLQIDNGNSQLHIVGWDRLRINKKRGQCTKEFSHI